MAWHTDVVVFAGLGFSGWLIAMAVEEAGKKIAHKLDTTNYQLERLVAKLDALWQPLNALRNQQPRSWLDDE